MGKKTSGMFLHSCGHEPVGIMVGGHSHPQVTEVHNISWKAFTFIHLPRPSWEFIIDKEFESTISKYMKRLKYYIKILIEQFCLHKYKRWERKTKGLRGTYNFIKKIKIIKIYWKTLFIKFLPRHLFLFSIQDLHCWNVSPTGTFAGLRCEARFWKFSTVQVGIQILWLQIN